MTRQSIIVGVRGRDGRAWAEAWALLDCDAARPPEGSAAEAKAEAGGLTASSLPLLDYARSSSRAHLTAERDCK